MATWYLFKQQTTVYVEKLYNSKRDAEESRFKEHIAAVKIQAWYKGIRLRCYIKNLNCYAKTIQRHWRGFINRRQFRHYLSVSYDMMCINKYNKSAIIIQKYWKGYYIRKNTFNYYQYKKYLLDLEIKNNSTIQFINEFQQNQLKEEEISQELKQLEEMKLWALKNHHLISTKVQPGIYNSPFNKKDYSKELVLKLGKNTEKTEMKKKLVKKKSANEIQVEDLYDQPCTLITEKPLPIKHLPPLLAFAPQGPFKTPEEVRKQRIKKFNPTLRVMTDFESLDKARILMKNEEWTKRLHDDIFYPVISRLPQYESMLATDIPYKNTHVDSFQFRDIFEMDKNKILFKNIVPPIQSFDKLNKEYIENYSI